ncbi:MAG: flagellar basal body L-ring protein FlgH [Phycisphaerae bacterium]
MNRIIDTISATIVVALLADAALAQNNSRFRRNNQPQVPTSQPAGNVLGSAEPAPQSALREPKSDADTPPPPNPELLRVSLIAIETPPPRKLQVNDLITVVVREDLRSTSDATLKQDKKWDISTAIEDWIRFDGDEHLVPQNFTRGVPNVGFQYDDKYEGKGKTERKDSLITRVQARVVDVKPNGTLLIEAKRRIRTGEDIVNTTLTGTCRSEDVSLQNTVLSTQIYDLNIENKPEGAANDAAERGWLKKLVDFLKPL